jgi:hypothetical protein
MRGGGEKTARLGVLSCLLLTTCYTGDQSRKIEMGGACGTYGGEESCVQGFDEEARSREATWKI